ncbi:hypothetical protein FRC06_001203, partial [Ceratobasidium sp. 370]
HVSVQGSHRSSFSATFLAGIARTCPGIRLLDFHPKLHEPANTVVAQSKLLRDFAALPSFQNLRFLISTPVILQSPVLELVAQLPCLKRMTIQPNYPGANWDPSSCQQLPPGSFPALDTLVLSLGTSRDANRFWELIPLPNLKDLDLTMESVANDNELQFIPTLCRASPQITSLQLSFPAFNEPHGISARMFEHLARLPLDRIFSLECAILDFEGAWFDIADAWPHLKMIRCLDQPTGLTDLLYLSSSLPGLEYVKCDLDLEQAARTVQYNWRPAGQPPFFPNLTDLIIKQFELRELVRDPEGNLGSVAR